MLRAALILLAGFALGSAASVTRFGVQELQPIVLVTLRWAVASLVFVVLLLVRRTALPASARTWRDLILVGLSQDVPVLWFTASLQYISSGVLSIIIALIPLITALMAHRWLQQERLKTSNWLGLLLAFAGVFWLIITRTSGLQGVPSGQAVQGQLLALAGSIVSAAGVIYARLHLRAVNATVTTAGQMFTGLLVALPFALAGPGLDLAAVTSRGWFTVVYTGIIGSSLGFLLLFYMVQRYGATVAMLPSYVMPPVSAIIGGLWLGEMITPVLLGAGILILIGLFLSGR
jgi:drug/metabolite transporter (DMT)-like permease